MPQYTIRNIPEALDRELRERAKRKGISLNAAGLVTVEIKQNNCRQCTKWSIIAKRTPPLLPDSNNSVSGRAAAVLRAARSAVNRQIR